MTEMPFPQISMSPAEIECILETALNLGMDVKQRGTVSFLLSDSLAKITSHLEDVYPQNNSERDKNQDARRLISNDCPLTEKKFVLS